MRLPTKRFDKSLPLPKYESGAAAFDFQSRLTTTIRPRSIKPIPSNIAVAVPKGYMLLVLPRSSTASKYGLLMPHSLGIIDPFYNGEDNEIMLVFYNFTNRMVKINKGDTIAQGILVKYDTVQFDESKKLKASKRSVWKSPKKK